MAIRHGACQHQQDILQKKFKEFTLFFWRKKIHIAKGQLIFFYPLFERLEESLGKQRRNLVELKDLSSPRFFWWPVKCSRLPVSHTFYFLCVEIIWGSHRVACLCIAKVSKRSIFPQISEKVFLMAPPLDLKCQKGVCVHGKSVSVTRTWRKRGHTQRWRDWTHAFANFCVEHTEQIGMTSETLLTDLVTHADMQFRSQGYSPCPVTTLRVKRQIWVDRSREKGSELVITLKRRILKKWQSVSFLVAQTWAWKFVGFSSAGLSVSTGRVFVELQTFRLIDNFLPLFLPSLRIASGKVTQRCI